YLRLLFARVGRVHCGVCGSEARSDSAESVAEALTREHTGARALICFPLPAAADPRTLFPALVQRGFARIKVGATVVELTDLAGRPVEAPALPSPGRVSVVLDRVV